MKSVAKMRSQKKWWIKTDDCQTKNIKMIIRYFLGKNKPSYKRSRRRQSYTLTSLNPSKLTAIVALAQVMTCKNIVLYAKDQNPRIKFLLAQEKYSTCRMTRELKLMKILKVRCRLDLPRSSLKTHWNRRNKVLCSIKLRIRSNHWTWTTDQNLKVYIKPLDSRPLYQLDFQRRNSALERHIKQVPQTHLESLRFNRVPKWAWELVCSLVNHHRISDLFSGFYRP